MRAFRSVAPLGAPALSTVNLGEHQAACYFPLP